MMERHATPKAFVTPAPNDVLCGRGRISFQHEGNRKFRFLIASHLSQYTQARTKKQKIDLVRGIAQTIKERGGRFLKQDRETKLWFDAGVQAARKKVGHSLRDASNDKIKCVRAMSKSLERNNALMQELRAPKSTEPTTPELQEDLIPGSLYLPAAPVSSSNTVVVAPIPISMDPMMMTTTTINGSQQHFDDSESTSLSSDEGEEDLLELLDPFQPVNAIVNLTEKCPHSCGASGSIGSECLSIFNDINLRDLEEYCDRQEEAMKARRRASDSSMLFS